MDTKNGQSAAKLLNSAIEHGEGSETISEESREVNLLETEEILEFLFRFYVLIDPRDNKIRYVGRTKQSLKQRLRGHIYESLKNCKEGRGNKRETWINKIVSLDLKPKIKEIYQEFCSIKEADKIEKRLILEYFEKYEDLLNDDDHGIGLVFGNNRSKYVYQYSLDGTFMREWFNANTVCSELGYSDADIGRCCKLESEEGQLSAYGYYWSYNKYDKYPIKEKNKNYKKVYQFDCNKTLVKIFNSAKEASKELNIPYKYFCSKCSTAKEYNGFIYSYNKDCSCEQSSKNKRILCFDKNGTLIKEYISAAEAAKDIGLANSSSIIQCCKGKQKSAKNFIWKYKD